MAPRERFEDRNGPFHRHTRKSIEKFIKVAVTLEMIENIL
jgi:hypothetical protein